MPDFIIHGASSFIGRHFTKMLSAKADNVVVLARQQSNLDFLSKHPTTRVIRYSKNLSEINIDKINLDKPVFYEFSWYGVFGSDRNDPDQIAVNIPLMINSVSFADQVQSSHWIGIGSQAEYGNLDKRISESDPSSPTTLYGKAKLICSQATAELCRAYGMEHSWLRLFSVFGPDDNHEWLIQYLIRKMLLNEEIQVTKGEQKWDYLYIDDITRVLLILAEKKGVGIANLGSGSSVTVKSIIEKIRELTQTKSEIKYGAIPYRPDQVMLMEADNTLLMNHTGWKPQITLDAGLAKTISHLKETLQLNS